MVSVKRQLGKGLETRSEVERGGGNLFGAWGPKASLNRFWNHAS